MTSSPFQLSWKTFDIHRETLLLISWWADGVLFIAYHVTSAPFQMSWQNFDIHRETLLLVSWSSIYSISCDIGIIPDELAKCWYPLKDDSGNRLVGWSCGPNDHVTVMGFYL